jgi:hypothetical protein
MNTSNLSLNHVPFRVDPLKWESPRGYLCRVAAAHSYASPLWLLNVAGLSSPAEAEGEHNIDAMAFALRLSGEEWRSMTYLRICGTGRFKKRRFLGHVVGASQLSLGISRVCSHCLIEQSVWWAVWDLGMSAACVRHRCLLSSRCSRCGQALKWNRPAVHLCHCGSDLRWQHAAPANCELLAVTEAIHSMAGIAARTRGHVLGFPEELYELSLDAALTFLQALGSHSESPLKKRSAFAATQLASVTEVCESAAHALAEWPNGFYRVLSRTMASRAPTIPRMSFVQAFSNFYRYYLKVQSHPEFQFLQKAFANFAAFKWQGVIRGQHRAFDVEIRQNAQFIPALQAGKASRTSSRQITTLVLKGLIKGFFIQTAKAKDRKECWIERQSLAKWLSKRNDDLKRYLPSTKAMQILGVTDATLRCLINAAVIRNIVGGDHGLPRGTYIPRADLTKILKAFHDAFRASKVSSSLETVMLRDAVRIYLGREGLVGVIRAVAKGRLSPHDRCAHVPGLLGYSFCLDHLDAFRFRTRNRLKPPDGYLTFKQAAARISVNAEVVRNLVSNQILKPCRNRVQGAKVVREKDVDNFASQYVSLSSIAADFKTSSRYLARLLQPQDAGVLRIPLPGKGQKIFVRRSAVGSLNLLML